jgi:hypothetical protein
VATSRKSAGDARRLTLALSISDGRVLTLALRRFDRQVAGWGCRRGMLRVVLADLEFAFELADL